MIVQHQTLQRLPKGGNITTKGGENNNKTPMFSFPPSWTIREQSSSQAELSWWILKEFLQQSKPLTPKGIPENSPGQQLLPMEGCVRKLGYSWDALVGWERSRAAPGAVQAQKLQIFLDYHQFPAEIQSTAHTSKHQIN